LDKAKLRDIVSHLQETYCKSIGVEYRYMTKPEIVQWLQNKMEGSKNQEVLSNETKLHVLDTLVEASGLEDYMHKKFVGQKRFSLEGPKRLFPLSITIISHGGQYDANDIVIGMAHRGRLNVLANIMKKPYWEFFEDLLLRDMKTESYMAM